MGLKVRKAESVPQASRVFTDREIPRKSFWKNYNDFKSKMNDGDIKVLAYYGIGGIGKSTLLRKLISEMDEAKAAGIISDSLHVYFDLNLKIFELFWKIYEISLLMIMVSIFLFLI